MITDLTEQEVEKLPVVQPLMTHPGNGCLPVLLSFNQLQVNGAFSR